MSWKIIVVSISLFLLGGILGTLVTVRFNTTGQTTQSVIDTTSPSYQSGFNAARKLVEESDQFSILLQNTDDVRYISGNIVSIEGNRVNIHTPSVNLFEKNIENRTLLITSDTQIIKREPKDAEVFIIEKTAFNEKLKSVENVSVDTWLNSPSPFNEKNIPIGDLRVGIHIDVSASYNIKDLTEFTPSAIFLEPKMF